jgi:flagellar basal body-associated protein FliL
VRKLAWLVIIVLIVALSVAVACAYSPSFSATIYDFGVNVVGASIVNGVTGAMTGMMAWGSTGLGPSVAIVAGWSLAAIIFWTVVLRKYIWTRYIKKEASTATTAATLQQDVSPVPLKVVEKKPEPVTEASQEGTT